MQTKAETIAGVLSVDVCAIEFAELTRDGLAPEGLTLGDLQVVAKFQVIGEVESVSYSHVTKTLEEVHLTLLVWRTVFVMILNTYRQRIAGLPCSSNKLSQNVELDLDTSSSKDDSRGNGED